MLADLKKSRNLKNDISGMCKIVNASQFTWYHVEF